MELITFLLLTWEKALIGLGVLFVIVYILLIYYALKSLFVFKKQLNSYETSVKMATIETITLIRDLEKLSGDQIDEKNSDLLEEIEGLVVQNIVKGNYKKVLAVHTDFVNKLKSMITDQSLLEKVENNVNLQKEIDKLYQKALSYHSADLSGYNYWAHFILTRPFTLMFKFKKRDSIY
jgi:hypothetical protein